MAGYYSREITTVPSRRLAIAFFTILASASLASASPANVKSGLLDKVVYVSEDPAIDKWRSELSGAGIYPAHYALKAIDLLPLPKSPSRYVRVRQRRKRRSSVIIDDSLGIHRARVHTPPSNSTLETRRRHKSGKKKGGYDENGYDDGSWRGDRGDYGSSRKGAGDDEGTSKYRSGEAENDFENGYSGTSGDSYYEDGEASGPEIDEEGANDGPAEEESSTFDPDGQKSKFKAYGESSSGSPEDRTETGWRSPGTGKETDTLDELPSRVAGDRWSDASSPRPKVSGAVLDDKLSEETYDDPSSSPSRPSSDDCDVLKQFYEDMGGPEWRQQTGWTSSSSSSSDRNCCRAYGVSCNALGRVTALNLGSNGLSGPLSAAVFELRYLNKLNISSNAISAELPDKFDSLTRLGTLYLDQNALKGSLPTTLQQSSSISSLHISNNTFEGTLAFPNARNLTQLYAARNRLTDLDITANAGLIKVALDDNQFNCTLPDIEDLTDLQVFSVARNHFVGSMPNVGKLQQLVRLDLQANQLSGTFPDVTGLPRLQYLGLNGNSDLSGPFPTGKAPSTLITCHVDTLLASSCPAQTVLDDPDSLAAKCSLSCRGGGKPSNATPDADATEEVAAPAQPSTGAEGMSKQRLKSLDEGGQTPASLAESLSGRSYPRLDRVVRDPLVLLMVPIVMSLIM